MRGVAVATLAALVLGACGAADDVSAGPPELADHRGRFVTTCAPSHHAGDDPLVHPDQPGAAHLHEFFGNRAVEASSTVADIEHADTTCETVADRASYWVPALLDGDGDRIPPDGADVYYRAGRGVDPTSVEPYPLGLAMIAGHDHDHAQDAGAKDAAHDVGVAGWSCSANPARSARPPSCAGELRLRVTFPDCWNGEDLRSDDHRSHVAYSGAEGCPPSHPVAVPQLEVVVRYPHTGDADSLSLSSGDVDTAHADFWNLWDPGALAREVRSCIHRDVVCGDALT